MKLDEGRRELVSDGLIILGIGVAISLGGYFIGQFVPTRLGNHVSFLGIFFGIGLIAIGCWYIYDSLK
jgi:hypothetical protein